MLLSSDCAKGFVAYRDDYCLSIHDADAYCWGEGPCQIFLIGNHTYDPGLYPCHCRRRVTPGVCGIVGEPLCNYSLAAVEEEVTCALRRTTVAATTTTTNTSGEQGVSSTTTTWDTGSVSSGWRPHIPALLVLSFYQDDLTGSAWGDWSLYTDSPLFVPLNRRTCWGWI
eukprot:symbB.v1.2.012829.t1/scaffold893.1/size154614/10